MNDLSEVQLGQNPEPPCSEKLQYWLDNPQLRPTPPSPEQVLELVQTYEFI
jgi:hypothetical protein